MSQAEYATNPGGRDLYEVHSRALPEFRVAWNERQHHDWRDPKNWDDGFTHAWHALLTWRL